jgi:hypothetical protein
MMEMQPSIGTTGMIAPTLFMIPRGWQGTAK